AAFATPPTASDPAPPAIVTPHPPYLPAASAIVSAPSAIVPAAASIVSAAASGSGRSDSGLPGSTIAGGQRFRSLKKLFNRYGPPAKAVIRYAPLIRELNVHTSVASPEALYVDNMPPVPLAVKETIEECG